MTKTTHCDRVLAVLSDGQPHTHHELYARTFTIVHSRVSDLRRRGHEIDTWREGDDYLYRLRSSAGGGTTGTGAHTAGAPTATAATTAAPPPRGDERPPSAPAEHHAGRLF